jgi:acyl-CoA dehydrogenase
MTVADTAALRADDLLVETIGGLFADQCTPERAHAAEGGMDRALWDALEGAGLTLVGVDEEHGGSGGTAADALAIVAASGEHAAPVPIADTLTAARLLSLAGEAVPGGPLGIGVASGSAPVRVPWGGVAGHVLVCFADGAAITDAASLVVTGRGQNYAGEPWIEIDAAALTPTTTAISAAAARRAGALARATQMGGALTMVVDLCVQYANEREQFGKPIGKFQVLQHYLSEIAGEAVTAVAAAGNAADVIAMGCDPSEADQVVAAAKAVAGRAAGTVNRLAHQIHGAIGYTDEHRLQYWTRRLWSWRDEFGTEAEWAARLGASLATAGGAALWPRLTTWPRAV